MFTLQTLPAEPDAPRPEVAESSGFSLHAGIAAKASQRDKIERLARYVSRPPVATDRLSLTQGGNVRYALKTPYRDGTTHVIFEPEDFIARLVALVPKPRAHLTRYHGVFAPASPDRVQIVPSTRSAAATERGEVSVSDRQRAMLRLISARSELLPLCTDSISLSQFIGTSATFLCARSCFSSWSICSLRIWFVTAWSSALRAPGPDRCRSCEARPGSARQSLSRCPDIG